MGTPYAFMYTQDSQSLTTTVGITPVVLDSFTPSINNGVALVADYGFRILIAGVYRVDVAASFAVDNGSELSIHLYKNDSVTPYGSHCLGLTSIRNNLSFAGLLDLNIGDVLAIKASSDADGRTLTMYDCQLIVAGV